MRARLGRWLWLASLASWLVIGTASAQASARIRQVARGAARAHAQIDAALLQRHVHEASSVFGVPEPLVYAVIRVESNFKPSVVSEDGAIGLMQLLRTTASDMGVLDAFDPRQNVLGGTRYLRLLIERWGGDVLLAIASYNAGPGAVARYHGVPPYRETQRYVVRVLRHYRAYRAARVVALR